MDTRLRLTQLADTTLPPIAAVLTALVLFAGFLAASGTDPLQAYRLVWLGGFGTWYSWQNTLTRAAPLLLTSLCMAIPAQLGLVIIGAEGAFVLGGLAAVAVGLPLAATGGPPIVVDLAMAIAGIITGGALIAGCGALRHWRGVNETIASLLLAYIAIAVMNQLVEGPMRDPASLDRPSTPSLPNGVMLGDIPGTSVHVGLIAGLVFCVFAWVLIFRTTTGFAARIVGGNVRAGQVAGLPVARLILIMTFLGGAAAGLGGMIEVAAVQGAVSSDLATGAGYTGILVAFLARQNPLAIIPVSVLLGGLDAADGLLQQRLGLSDAAVPVLRGLLFVLLLAAESLRGRQPAPLPQLRLRRRARAAAKSGIDPARIGPA